MIGGWTPGRGLLRLPLAWLGLAILAAALPLWRGPWLAGGLLLLAAVLAAAGELARAPALVGTRRVASQLPLGQWTEVHLRFESRAPRSLRFEVFDHHPGSSEATGLPREVTLTAGETVELTYRLRPRRRGDAEFQRIEIWRRSALDLLRRRHWLGTVQPVRVLPNFRPILVQGLAGMQGELAQLGMHLQRRRGEGLEFQELRDYRDGDSLRQVDWKATARRGKLIARQYQDERNQQLILLLDCGRRMHAQEDDLTHFDHVLNAALLLTYVAIRQGDAVGLQAFAGEERWLPPTRGAGALTRMLEALHDLQTSTESPDYPTAAARLMERQRRRALVLLLTNLRDEDAGELLPTIHTLRRRHLVLVASTRELALGALRDQEITGHP
ncbi:MAG: DUF58 domain-containing protein, partial [Acidobacteriota bacterium]